MAEPKKTRKAATKPQPETQSLPAGLDIPAHRRCPICYAGNGGHGRAYSSERGTSYYKCIYHLNEHGSQAPGGCGHTWTAKVERKIVLTEHREVDVTTRNG